MPKNCLWEKGYFTLKRKLKKAYRRQTNNAVFVNVGTQKVATWYYNPKDIKQLCTPYFKIANTRPVGFFVPPSYLENYFKRHKLFLTILEHLEKLARAFGFLSQFSDHFLIELEINKQDL